jgi:hypothetical protein
MIKSIFYFYAEKHTSDVTFCIDMINETVAKLFKGEDFCAYPLGSNTKNTCENSKEYHS